MGTGGNSVPTYSSGLALLLSRLSSFFQAIREWTIRFAQHRLALFGGVIVALMIFLALFAPYLSVHDPNEMAVSFSGFSASASRRESPWE